MTPRIAWMLLPLIVLSSQPAYAGKYVNFDGTVVISDKPVANAILVPDDYVVPAPGKVEKFAPLRPQGTLEDRATVGHLQAMPVDRDVLRMLLDAINARPPTSRWLESERALYTQVLSQARADVVVAPVQVQAAAFDQPERLLMTARLARYIEAVSGRRVADPFLVDRALGSGARAIDQRDIERLAASLGATRIILSFTGHDRLGHQAFVVRVLELKEGAVVNQSENRWVGAFSQSDTPADALTALLPRLVEHFGLGAAEPPRRRQIAAVQTLPLPASLDAITRPSKDLSPVVRAYHLQLLGALYPWYSEHARDRAFVRSLVMLDEVQPDSPDYRFLKARALFALQRRPYALHVLGTPKTPEEIALKAALDGNLPDLEKAVSQIGSPLKKFIAQLDLTELRSRYSALDGDKDRGALAATLKGHADWERLMLWKARDWDPWDQRSNIELKVMLDRSLPAPGASAESLVRAQAASNEFDPRNGELELSVYQHTHKLLSAKAADWCCGPPFAMPNRWDYLDLVGDLAETNLTSQVEFYLNTQGQPERAAEVLGRYERVYKDNPSFVALRGWVDLDLAERRPDPERENLLRESVDSALRALYWSQGETWAAWEGNRILRKHAEQAPMQQTPADQLWMALSNAYIGDWPIRWYWPTWEQGGNPRLMEANAIDQLAYSTHSFASLTELLQYNPGNTKKVVTENADRFVGHPDRVKFLAQSGDALVDVEARKKVYQDAIRANPIHWLSYYSLAMLWIEEGNYAEAVKIYNSYPGFAPDSKIDHVSLSQYANGAATALYWKGAIDEARPFLKLAADYETGSYGSMYSAAHLKILERDYRGAAQENMDLARRYNDPYAYRDFLGLLHIMGYSKDAWPIFDATVDKVDQPQLWVSAFIGQRMAGVNDKQMEQWLSSDRNKNAVAGDFRFAPMLAVLWYAVDRKPNAGFSGFVEQLSGPSRNFVAANQAGWTVKGDPKTNPEGAGLRIVGPSSYKAEGRPKRVPGTVVRSYFGYFAEAYSHMRDDDFAGANRIFEEMASHYEFAGTFGVGYFARAAAKSGNGEVLERYLDGQFQPQDRRNFDYQLAKAFFAGAKGHDAQALQHLRDAFNTKPATNWRPVFVEYQWVEACEWLYQDRKNKAYRDLALNWARSFQRMAPENSWAYAVEAELTDSPQDRRRALGITLYLDPNSERASKFSAAERAKAKEWLKANNPFLKPAGKRDQA